MPVRKPQTCMKCDRLIDTNEGAAALSLFYQTVGMGKQRTSKSERLYLCTQCALATAMGSQPGGNHPIEVAAYFALQNLVGTDPGVCAAGYEELHRKVVARLSRREAALPAPEIIPPQKRLNAAV
jgi:hypothetical protein